ncbi:MAG: NAD(P)H-dependent oxidoreductase subunit E [Hyphomicrobiales bacterium]|nr:NAD(P)H-dependent oxidoreductase subunit E [Hyphomicrobiales bacterium]MCP5372596.1 NAD(P)H-dependent oxidoreductase subunit E [Hyphomicrobiales bacterium]
MAKRSGDKRFFPKGRQLDDGALAEMRALLGDAPRRRDLLIEHLHRIQDARGHITPAHLAALAAEMGLAQAEVYEVATFYAHFDVLAEGEAPPPPLTVRVCDGIACDLAGARGLLDALKDGLGDGVRVIPAPCIGGCDTAPMAVVGQHRLGHADAGRVGAAVAAGRTAAAPPAAPRGLAAYRADGGYSILAQCLAGERQRDDVLDAIAASGLRGLGGAGFPSATKKRFLSAAPKPRVVAVNADEGEPGTFKDRYCLETDPHRMVEGALIDAWAVEAEDVYIYLRDEYPHVRAVLERTLAEVAAAGLAPHAALHLRRGAGAYICGEESAMLESIEGKRGLPRNRPPFPAQAGLFGRPTLIHNVETLYWLPAILARGADWYQNAGRPHFFSVSGRVRNPGVIEAPCGVTLNELIRRCGGMAEGHVLKGFLPGGASGGILPADKADVPLDFGTLDEFGCFVGSSAVVVFSQADDIRAIAANLVRFFEDESCGQCTPCRVGCEKMLALLDGAPGNADLIRELAAAMRDASICGLGQAAPNPVLSMLRFFEGDLS